MRVLITGGCGFIGSNFIKYFIQKHPDYELLNVDKLTYAGNLENLKEIRRKKHYHFIKADISSPTRMRRIFKKFKPDAVINFAAETHVDRSIAVPSPFVKTNVVGAGILLNLVLKNDIKKFMHISTDEVYGSITHGKFSETSPLNPSSPYAASKAAADGLVLAYYKTYKIPVLITRSSNNYGPYQFPEKYIPLVIHNALQNKQIPLYGDGMHVRDWLYVRDNCEALDVIFHKGAYGHVYNIGSGHELTNFAVIKRIFTILNKDTSLISYVRNRPGHDRRYALTTRKIKRLGWRPRTPFARGIKKTIQWYRQNGQWLENTQTGEYRRFYKKYYSRLGLTEF
ncbi:dTDP-glucose 4,6-dehydratase [candidate division WOR_3 bacterium SM23_60]|uniref:dTDP-glucose 4,6-dehydratase n=1 Tax=candidate division WOR_3 bacterium SM23_60 TaxID=1703780 RepID=A0A0S8GI71_UNCW3|nr:MAG: dTDP-glucose 4,6-dehydratase [candidate division WOR_3 bacterium SM23_60]